MPRPSHVRDAIHALITSSDRHDWSADDVLAVLDRGGIAADFSTVCRGLARLEVVGEIRRVYLGDGKMRYEARRPHHDHVRCNGCGSVEAVPGCAVSMGHGPVERATGYTITGHSLVFSGLCGDCARQDRA